MDKEGQKKEHNEEELLVWTSPSRLFKKRDKEYFTNIVAIVFLFCVIFVFAREYALMAAAISILFLVYVLATVPPEDIKHRLTSMGIESAGHYNRWEEFADFWFEEQWGQVMMVLRPMMGPRMIILLGSEPRAKVKGIVADYIPYREEPVKSWVDNAATWITEKIPLEKPQS